MEQNKKQAGSRKQITFDLSQKALAEHYPRPKFTINPKFYKKAYADISQFMKKHGFEHPQFSVYASIEKITGADIKLLVSDLAKEMPWLVPCVNKFDVTNISSLQYNLLNEFKVATTEQAKQMPSPQRQTAQKIMDTAKAIAQQRNSEHHTEHQKPHKTKETER